MHENLRSLTWEFKYRDSAQKIQSCISWGLAPRERWKQRIMCYCNKLDNNGDTCALKTHEGKSASGTVCRAIKAVDRQFMGRVWARVLSRKMRRTMGCLQACLVHLNTCRNSWHGVKEVGRDGRWARALVGCKMAYKHEGEDSVCHWGICPSHSSDKCSGPLLLCVCRCSLIQSILHCCLLLCWNSSLLLFESLQ